MKKTPFEIAEEYAEKRVRNALIGQVLDLKLKALKDNRMDVYDFIEDYSNTLLAKQLKEL